MDVVVIPAWYPTANDPVAGIFIRQQAKALHAAGINISVFYVEERAWPCFSGDGTVRFTIEDGVPTFRLTAFVPPKRIKGLRWWWLRQWERLLAAYREREGSYPLLLHAHSFVGGVAARFLGKKYGLPYVLTEHYSGLVGGTVPRHWVRELQTIYGDAARVIAVSPTLAAAMKPYIDFVSVIPNMIDTNIFYSASERIWETGASIKLISVGSLIPRKNYDLLLQVFAECSDQYHLHLTIIGEGTQRKDLQQLARKLRVDSSVDFTGVLSPVEVASRMRSSHLYVSTSKTESFALAPLEALACGLPVVMLRCGSVLENFDDPAVKIIDQPTGLGKAIYDQLQRIQRKGSNSGYHGGLDVFSSGAFIFHHLKLYEEVLNIK